MGRKRSNLEYSLMLKTLRSMPYEDLDGTIKKIKITTGFEAKDGYDLRNVNNWSSAMKAKVTKYFKAVDELTSRPFYPFKPRKEEHLKTAQKFSQHEKHLPNLKVAFVPTGGEAEPIIKFNKKGEMRVRIGGTVRMPVFISNQDLMFNMEDAVRGAVKHLPFAELFTVQAGKWEISNPMDLESVIEDIEQRQIKYSDITSNHYWGNWLHGVIAYSFDTDEDISYYFGEFDRKRRELKRKRKNAKEAYRRTLRIGRA